MRKIKEVIFPILVASMGVGIPAIFISFAPAIRKFQVTFIICGFVIGMIVGIIMKIYDNTATDKGGNGMNTKQEIRPIFRWLCAFAGTMFLIAGIMAFGMALQGYHKSWVTVANAALFGPDLLSLAIRGKGLLIFRGIRVVNSDGTKT